MVINEGVKVASSTSYLKDVVITPPRDSTISRLQGKERNYLATGGARTHDLGSRARIYNINNFQMTPTG